MKDNVKWLMPVLACIVASVLSLFLPVLVYETDCPCCHRCPGTYSASFNIISFAAQSLELQDILADYSGPLHMNIDRVWLTLLAILAVLAIVAALVGVCTMSLQRPNKWQFIMALGGIIGTAIPAFIVLLAVVLSQEYFPGTFRCGVYPIVTPVAMVMCMLTVTKKHKRTQEEILAAERAKDLIRPGGDL